MTLTLPMTSACAQAGGARDSGAKPPCPQNTRGLRQSHRMRGLQCSAAESLLAALVSRLGWPLELPVGLVDSSAAAPAIRSGLFPQLSLQPLQCSPRGVIAGRAA